MFVALELNSMIIDSPWLIFRQNFHNQCGVDVGGWVRFPNPAWSSFFICIAGAAIFSLARKKKQGYLKIFGIVIVFCGIDSFLNHATGTYLGGVLDLFTMFIAIWMILIPVLWRLNVLRTKHYWLVIAIGVIIFTIFQTWNTAIGDVLFYGTAIFTALLVALVHFRERVKKVDRNLMLAVGFFTIGAISAGLDRLGILCVPDNHFLQGMGVWHLFASIAAVFLYFYLSRFKMPEWEEGV